VENLCRRLEPVKAEKKEQTFFWFGTAWFHRGSPLFFLPMRAGIRFGT